jgi:hypothetical protein
MTARRSRDKGARAERSVANALRANGIAAALPLLGRDLCAEVTARADGFRELYGWVTDRDALIVKADRLQPLVVVRLSLATEAKDWPGSG